MYVVQQNISLQVIFIRPYVIHKSKNPLENLEGQKCYFFQVLRLQTEHLCSAIMLMMLGSYYLMHLSPFESSWHLFILQLKKCIRICVQFPHFLYNWMCSEKYKVVVFTVSRKGISIYICTAVEIKKTLYCIFKLQMCVYTRLDTIL